MRLPVRMLLAASFILAGSSFAFAEQIDNPQYKMWSKFKPGTSVTTQTVNDMGGNKSEMETTTSLVEVSADKAVVETKMTMTNAGTKMPLPAQKQDVLAKIEKPAVPAGTEAPKAEVKESSETIDVAGKSMKCKVTETTSSANGMNTVSKAWTCEDIPGGMAKAETTMDGSMKGTSKTMVTAMDVK